jgi:hypothetical protein
MAYGGLPESRRVGANEKTLREGTTMILLERVLAALPDAKRAGKGWLAKCPAHNDHTPSLSVREGQDGRPLLHCFGGCKREAIVAAMGWTMRDLMPSNGIGDRQPTTKRAAATKPKVFETLDKAADAALMPIKREHPDVKVRRFSYRPDYIRLRFDWPGGKTFRDVSRNDKGWLFRKPAGRSPLYHADRLPGAELVFIVEGEPKVEALEGLGLTATTSGSASSSNTADWTPLKGTPRICILPDNDKPGLDYSCAVKAKLPQAKIVPLPGLAEHQDVVDWLDKRDSQEPETIVAALMQIVEAAPAAKAVEAKASDPTDIADAELILDPADPRPSARTFINRKYRQSGICTIVNYAGDFRTWMGRAYAAREDAGIRAELYHLLASARRRAPNSELVPFQPTANKVSNVVDALAALTHQPLDLRPPRWLVEPAEAIDPSELLPCANGLLHLPTSRLYPPTPAFFNLHALDVDFNPSANPPRIWLNFLTSLWHDDVLSVRALQDWFGYVFGGDTRLHKILLIVGPKRSGKGTIGRVIRALLGNHNVAAPTLAGLTKNFGLQALLNFA